MDTWLSVRDLEQWSRLELITGREHMTLTTRAGVLSCDAEGILL